MLKCKKGAVQCKICLATYWSLIKITTLECRKTFRLEANLTP
jgi:hypothetical protein